MYPAWLAGQCAAAAKRYLAAGETLDGEGGYTVWRIPGLAEASENVLPTGRAHGVPHGRRVKQGEILTLSDATLFADDIIGLYKEAQASG